MIAVGVDQGARSGWAIGDSSTGTIGAWGVATKHADRIAVLQRAAFANGGTLRGVVVMFEDHSKMPLGRLGRGDHNPNVDRGKGRFGAPQRSTESILGQGAAKGRWLELLDMLGHPVAGRMKVEPRTWRARLGIVAKGSEALKLEARRYAAKMMGLTEAFDDDDLAEGVCLCMYAILDAEVLASLKNAHLKATKKEQREAASQAELFPADAHKLFNTGAK
jgi:hypothetical protein